MINFLQLKKLTLFILSIITISAACSKNINAQSAEEDFKSLLKEEAEDFKLLSQEFIKNKSNEYLLKSTYKYDNNGEEIKVPVLMGYPGESNLKEAGVSKPSSIHDIYFGLNFETLEGKLEGSKLYGLKYEIEKLLNKEKLVKWQIQHGDILNDLPVLALFPLDVENFHFKSMSIYQGPSSRNLSNSVNYYNQQLNKSVEVIIEHGLKARINFEVCDKSSTYSVNGNEYNVEKNTSRRNKTSLTLKYYQNEILVTLRTEADENRDLEAELEELKPLLVALDIEAMEQFEFFSVQQPFENVSNIPMEKDIFKDFITIQNDDYNLDKVTTREDKMIVTYHISTPPEQANFKLHLAYGDFGKEIKGSIMSVYRIKRFTVFEEFECDNAEDNRKDNLDKIKDSFSFDKINIARWEKENIDFSKVNSLIDLMPAQIGDFKITILSPDMYDPEAKFAYKNEKGKEIKMAFTYGDEAIKEYLQYQLMTFNKNENNINGVLSVKNFNYQYIVKRDNLIVYTFDDNLLIAFYIDSEGSTIKKTKATLKSFLREFEIEKVLNWERPKDHKITFPRKSKDGVDICLDTKCMEEKLANCEPAVFGGRLSRRLSVFYQIEESKGNHCKLAMIYDHNPNDDWEGKPLYFTIPKNGDFDKEVVQKVTDCLEGKSDDCSGPLLDEIE
ncbi:hypothetical protein ABWH96_19930 [Marivirga tractuosa]|uniref:hypothetical protein n=1 Tax=Marivirga tractuosa TaxID=1006 RepID=UPI0035CF80CE